MVKSLVTLTTFFVFISIGTFAANAANADDSSAFASKLDGLRIIVTIPYGMSGGDSFEFHGKNGTSCTIKTPRAPLNTTDGIDGEFRFADAETGILSNNEVAVNKVTFTNSGIFPAEQNHSTIQCTGEFKNPKDVLKAFEGTSGVAGVSWTNEPSAGNKTLAQEIGHLFLKVGKAIIGESGTPSVERSISSVPLTGANNKPEDSALLPPSDVTSEQNSATAQGMPAGVASVESQNN